MEPANLLETLEGVWQDILSTRNPGWGAHIMEDCTKLIACSASPVSTVFEHVVNEHQRNGMDNMHGGCTATLFDTFTSMTLLIMGITKPGSWPGSGVTRYLNVTYLRPAPIGEVLIVESEVVDLGKRLCMLKGVMKRKSDGKIIATCEHGKVNIDPHL